MIEYGIYANLSNEAYHADPAISRSGIKLFCESPYKFWANYLNPDRPAKKTTDAMEFGSAFHTFILEPDKFNDFYLVEAPVIYKKDVSNEIWEDYKRVKEFIANSNKTVISSKDYQQMFEMRDALMHHPQAWDLIKGRRYEESYFWRDKHSGLMVKARPDIISNTAIIDLKTCTSADSRTFQKDMYLGMYHVQGAMAREGIKQLTGVDIPIVINISIEKTYPYAIGIKIISQSALEAGHMKFKQALLDMKACMASNEWNSYAPEEVELPTWAN